MSNTKPAKASQPRPNRITPPDPANPIQYPENQPPLTIERPAKPKTSTKRK